MILAAKFPLPDAKTSVAFAELARRRGDFALVGLAAVAALEHLRAYASASADRRIDPLLGEAGPPSLAGGHADRAHAAGRLIFRAGT